MPLSDTSISIAVRATETSALDLVTGSAALNASRAIALANGTGASQADKIFTDRRTIAISGTDDIDLAGTLVGHFGAVVTFVKVKVIAVFASAANTNNVVIGAAAATQFVGPFGAATHTIAVPPAGMFAIARADATGWAVGAGASDLLRLANSGAGTSVEYDIVIIGTSA